MDQQVEIRDERLRLAGRLRSLNRQDFDRPSMCEGWAVRHVLAHLVTPFLVSPTSMASTALRRGGISAAMDLKARQIAERPATELVDILEQHADSKFRPPGLPAAAPLTDVVAHSADIRWVLGDGEVDWAEPERLRPVLDFLVSRRSRMGFVPAGRVRNLRLVADDVDWEHGAGAEVRGPRLAVALGILGRPAAARQLSGNGVAALAV